MKRFTVVLCALSLSLLGCGGGGSSSQTVTQSPPVEEKIRLTINGIATDAPLAGADVTLMLDGVETDHTTTTDNDGHYSFQLEFVDSDLDKFVTIKAMGTGSQITAGLISLVGELNELVEDAGDDKVLVASENFGVIVSHLTTAKYGLLIEANESEEVHSQAVVERLSENISQQDILTLATAIKVAIDKAVDNAELALPPGFDDTLELMRYSEVMHEYVNSVLLTEEFTAAQKETLDDPTIYDSALTFPTSFELYFLDFAGTEMANHAFKFNADNTGKYQNVDFSWKHSGSSLDIQFAKESYTESFSFEGEPQQSVRRLHGLQKVNLRMVSESDDTLGLAVRYTHETLFPDDPERENEVVETSELVTATMDTYLISFATPTTLHIPLADQGNRKGLTLNSDAVDFNVRADKFTFNADGTAVGEITGITANWLFENDALILEYVSSTQSWLSDYVFPFTSMAMRKVSSDNFVDKVQVNLSDANGVETFANVYQANLSEKSKTWDKEEIPGIYAFEFDLDGSALNQFYFILHENGDADTISTDDENGDGELTLDEVTRFYGTWTVEENSLQISRTMLRNGASNSECRTPGVLSTQEECLLFHERSMELINRQDDEFYLFHNGHFYFQNVYGEFGENVPDYILWDLRRLYKTSGVPVDLSHL
ncbi:hypothetical protein OPS25_09910 [Alteromonas ponticola]|uniref:Carboxypeptidase regulatory-like domain-containing protein n=1 Tax=Alteromonas aquimaris TaxID=2998417 RepID=A0ABT3P7R3_9ALTE|nr:hypothetical protein [Alteromonas aquimaris]MCW8108807.1 hypothetical protein [Alteromonas aquimaris]